MKKKWILLIAIVLIGSVLFAACSQTDTVKYNLDGNTSDQTNVAAAPVDIELSTVSADDYLENVTVTAEEQTVVDSENSIIIDLSTLTADTAPEGTSFSKNTLTIGTEGSYTLTGTLNGAVEVAANIEGTVQIILDNAVIHTTDSQKCAAIVFKEATGARILTVKDGTINEISDSSYDSTANKGDGAALQAKKCSLTINGQGTLKVLAVGDDASGIKVKKTLTINGTTLVVSATKNGIKADNMISIQNANITVTAGNDGIKTDIEPSNDEEAKAYAAEKDAGYIYIEKSSITITAGDDGIAANNCLYIANEATDRIVVTSLNTALSDTETTNGKALKAGGITLVVTDDDDNETEIDYPATFEENYAIVITGGTFEINVNDDAIHSEGNVLISGGTFTIASGDDAIHAEYITKITDGNINISKCYEGVEGALIEISGGTLNITSSDDGINAANADLSKYDFNIYITGGSVTVNSTGDGLDSNGKLVIAGGIVYVYGPERAGNSALDSDSGTTIQGGTVIATCASAMDSVNSTQYMINANCTISAGSEVTLKNASGETVITFTMPKTAGNVIISTPDLTSGSYTLSYGTTNRTVTATTGRTGGMGGIGEKPGGLQPGNRPNGNRIGSGDMNRDPAQSGEPPLLPENGEMPTPPDGAFGDMTPPDGGNMGNYPQGGPSGFSRDPSVR